MKNIQFRVWCQDHKEWEKSAIVLNKDGIVIHLNQGNLQIIRPERHIVQFFTGMHDKNSKQIFEGDILKIKTFNGHGDTEGFYYRGTVVYDDKTACYRAESHYPIAQTAFAGRQNFEQYLEIIGNIFETPNLLLK